MITYNEKPREPSGPAPFNPLSSAFGKSPPDPRAAIRQALRDFRYFNQLKDRDLDMLAMRVTPLVFDAGATVVKIGEVPEFAYFLLDGRVKMMMSAKPGTGRVFMKLGTGEMLGLASIAVPYPSTNQVVALEPCSVLRLARGDFLYCCEQSPAISHAFIRTLARRLFQGADRAATLL